MRPLVKDLLGAARHDRAAPVIVGLAFVALFLLASTLAGWHHERQRRFAREWYAEGEALLAHGRPAQAVEAFESALAYGREDASHRFRLATALVAARRDGKARAYLLELWRHRPGDGAVNLELARLESRAGRLEEAVGYYQHALNGSWATRDPVAMRRRVRLELAEVLIAAASTARAEAELITLAAESPRVPDASARLGDLLLRVGAARRALALFRSALSERPQHAGALSGAGRAAFALGDFASARRYLERAVRERPRDEDSRQLELAEEALAIDPFRPRLSSKERARRTLAAWQAATRRFASCSATSAGAGAPVAPAAGPLPPSTVKARLEELQPRVTPRSLVRDPDLLDETMDRVFEAETWATRHCGEPQGVDLALTLIGRRRAEVR